MIHYNPKGQDNSIGIKCPNPKWKHQTTDLGWIQDWLQDLWGPVKNENVSFFLKKYIINNFKMVTAEY